MHRRGGALVAAVVFTLTEPEVIIVSAEAVPLSPRKKANDLVLAARPEQVTGETIDPEYQRLIDLGAISAPVRVDPNAPAGTTFTSQGAVKKLAKSNGIVAPPKVENSTDSTSNAGSPVGRPGQVMADVIREQRAALKEQAQDYFAGAEAEKASLAQRAAAIGVPLRFEREDGRVDVLAGISASNDPIYFSGDDISGADTSAVDQLWPSGTVGVWNDPDNTGLNLSGAGEIIGLWEADGSVRVGHNQFTGRATQLDATPTAENGHATGVAGTLVSEGISTSLVGAVNLGQWSRGIAYASSLNAYNNVDFTGEFSNEAGSGLKFANNSYSLPAGWTNTGTQQAPIWRWNGPAAATATEDWRFGAYLSLGASITPRGIDDSANLAPNTLLIYSASNNQGEGPGVAVTNYLLADNVTPSSLVRDWTDGDDGGYDTMSSLGCAKNVLTVGAINSLEGGWASAGAVVQSSFSGTGPTDDGRIKPEVVAQGSRIMAITARNPNGWQNLMPWYFSATPDNTSYSHTSGTSFSAPVATGVLALVNERRTLSRSSYGDLVPPGSVVVIDQNWSDHPLRASGMRALTVHTADEAGPNPGPDYRFGYGVVNATRAVQLISNDSGSGTTPSFAGPKPFYKEVLLAANTKVQFKVNRIDASTPIKVTAAWSDPAGTGQTTNSVDQQTARLVNDLDVRIYPPGVVPSASTKNAATTIKPWILNPDLPTKSAVTRGAAADTGDDSRNNLEQTQANSPVAGDYTVVVDHKGFSLSGGQQWVSLVLSGVGVRTPPNLAATIVNNGGGNYAISWPSVVGAGYVLEKSLNGFFGWTPAGGEISASLETISLSVVGTPGASSEFWRVIRVY